MFPSDISSSLQNPFEYSAIYENPNTYFLNFPPQLLDDDELLLGHFLHHHQQPTSGATAAATTLSEAPDASTENSNKGGSTNNSSSSKDKDSEAAVIVEQKPPETGKKKRGTGKRQPGSTRRRTGKKDRHSKIYTAQGPRDRRMRLSLQIARKFFDLQDMLGFDKASKTIEWLFTKSKAAIKELTASLPQKKNTSSGSVSSAASECMAKDMEESRNDPWEQQGQEDAKRRNKNTRKGASHHHPSIARESRDKARARARQRTREKMLLKEIEKTKQSFAEAHPNTNNNNNLDKLGSSSATTPETGEETVGYRSQELNSSMKISAATEAVVKVKCSSSNHHQSLEQQIASVGIMETLLGTPRSSSIFDYKHHEALPISSSIRSDYQSFLGFPGNWVMENGRNISSGYGAAVMNITSTPLHEDQNPNSTSFMTTSSGIYLHRQLQHNHFSYNNSLHANGDRSLL
ncbi:hypothetical protein Nepgr_003693 [Nepenthes gracilis]|uniref:Uncharacterized protein n=1 Tax=Nepenthes gracilis TaxID=150966 RepID=A0AAD3RZZ5_NEPGR|nr:hypothetical protein Nepgr_003693 [Nepenthes gracilis]